MLELNKKKKRCQGEGHSINIQKVNTSVSQMFCNILVSVALDAFAKDVKVTGLCDGHFAWYSLSATQLICHDIMAEFNLVKLKFLN